MDAFAVEFRRVRNIAVEAYEFLEHLDRMAMHGLAMLLKGPGPY
ncbi:MAG TPA: hypothetical protein VFO34_00140 [Candidatus Acidoferrales bacterium]|nr:hypothetical protein [Candidatus Acidoferrales bacterium]